MREPVTVACAQVEPVLFDREATIGRIAEVSAEVSGKGTQLVLFPEAAARLWSESERLTALSRV